MAQPIDMTLTLHDLMNASHIGVSRQIENLFKERPNRYGHGVDGGWNTHIEGACGELALAKLLGVYWSGSLGNLAADDVGPFQVRTAQDDKRCLILHPADRDDRAFILVTGLAPKMSVRGWIYARDGKQDRWWRDPTGQGRYAYFVPQSSLRDMREVIDARR